jgi:hypothetical protein
MRMAQIHDTTLTPTKLELLAAWLPRQSWYVRGAGEPELRKAGGFRLDDPAGEVGIEFMIVTDTASGYVVAYLVPVTYRGAPVDGLEDALIGTSEHGVLGRRWVYDGVRDPVLVAELTALLRGDVVAQQQSRSDETDPTVEVHPGPSGFTVEVLRELQAAAPGVQDRGQVLASWQLPDGSTVRGPVVYAGS